MNSLPKSGLEYSPEEIAFTCRYFGWLDLARRIVDKERDLGLTNFIGKYHYKELFRPLVIYQIECWVGGSIDEKYIAKSQLAIAVCRILGHAAAEEQLSKSTGIEWGYGCK